MNHLLMSNPNNMEHLLVLKSDHLSSARVIFLRHFIRPNTHVVGSALGSKKRGLRSTYEPFVKVQFQQYGAPFSAKMWSPIITPSHLFRHFMRSNLHVRGSTLVSKKRDL